MNRITTADIDAALHDQARADGYDARLLHTDRLLRDDTQPCDTPDAIEVEYLPESVLSRHTFDASVMLICMVAFAAIAFIAWAMS